VSEKVSLPAGAVNDLTIMVSELAAAGYDRSDRKYLVWVDANVDAFLFIR
jgi:hypothetical protein